MKVLYLTARVPWVAGKGDQVLSFQRIRSLASLGAEIVLISFESSEVPDRAVDDLKNFVEEIHLVKKNFITSLLRVACIVWTALPAQVLFFTSLRYRRLVKNLLARLKFDLIHVCLSRICLNIPKCETPVVLDHIDSMGLNWEGRANKARNLIVRAFIKLEAKLVSRFERRISASFVASTTVSTIDSESIMINNPLVDVETIPLGVDSKMFCPTPNQAKEFDVIFAGNLSYEPNVDAASWFIQDVLPKLRLKIPDVRILLVGRNPTEAVKKLTSENRVELLSNVESMPAILNKGKVAICPMVSGSGMQNKVLEAMSCSLPVVLTKKGLGSIDAKDGKEVLIADSAQEFSDAIQRLLVDDVMCLELGKYGRQLVLENHSWDRHALRWIALYQKALQPRLLVDRTMLRFGVRGMSKWLKDLELGLVGNQIRLIPIDGFQMFPRIAKRLSSLFVPIWEQILLPYYIFSRGVKTPVLCPFNTGPILGEQSGRWIWGIHDLIFLSNLADPLPRQIFRLSISRLYRAVVFKLGAKSPRLILTPSGYSASQINRLGGVAKEKIMVFPNSSQRVGAQISREIWSGPLRLFSISGDVGSKNPQILIPMVKNLIDKGIICKLVVLGIRSAKNKASLARTARALGVHDWITFEGHISQPELDQAWENTDIFVLPSLEEGFGIPIIEAQSRGVPVVCGRWSCLPEVAGEAAFFVEQPTAQEFADAVADLKSNPELRAMLVEQGFQNSRRYDNESLLESARSVAGRIRKMQSHV
jgi:glycosyltransferase involved in cell wall biosynthesis